MGMGMGTRTVGTGWGWGQALVPVQLSSENTISVTHASPAVRLISDGPKKIFTVYFSGFHKAWLWSKLMYTVNNWY